MATTTLERAVSPTRMSAEAVERIDVLAERLKLDRSKIFRAIIECEIGVGDPIDAAIRDMVRGALAEMADSNAA